MKKARLNILILFIIPIAGCTTQYVDISPYIINSKIEQRKIPLFIGKVNQEVIKVNIAIPDTGKQFELQSVMIYMKEGSRSDFLESVNVQHIKKINGEVTQTVFGNTSDFGNMKISVSGLSRMKQGSHTLSFDFYVKEDALLQQSFRVGKIELVFDSDQHLIVEPHHEFPFRPALVLRESGQDNCDTYRIPGLVTTDEGTLIAVYDIRYNNSKDLQEDIDVGMSRSTDGGHTWEPMRVILDMGKWGGRPERLNGIGDPCILYDKNTGALWVAGLWMSGLTTDDMLWWSSQTGMSPEETGQFILVKSIDDGLTWSDPINITEQIKNPEWQLMLQGPGRGITMDNGTLVFPAQYKKDIGEKAIDGGQFTSHSTIVYSMDGGETWRTGNGAKSNTTEAQVVQLADGKLMLNMRDDRNRQVKDETNGRAVAVTEDMGQTWTVHSSSNSSLPEPTCMASLIAEDILIDGNKKQVLFFSNPNDKYSRTNMTIKASLDEGLTWPQEYQQEINEELGFGYSCLTLVGGDKIAILYEGEKELYYQLIPVGDIISDK